MTATHKLRYHAREEIDKEAVSVSGEKATEIKEAYIKISDREELA